MNSISSGSDSQIIVIMVVVMVIKLKQLTEFLRLFSISVPDDQYFDNQTSLT